MNTVRVVIVMRIAEESAVRIADCDLQASVLDEVELRSMLNGSSASDNQWVRSVVRPWEASAIELPLPESSLQTSSLVIFGESPSAPTDADFEVSDQFGLDPEQVRLIGELCRLMLDQISILASSSAAETQESASRDARLEAMAEFAAGAGHEINNPLGSIRGRAELLLRHEKDLERRRGLATIGAQVDRIRDMIGDAMLFARPPVPEPEVVRAAAIVSDEIEQAEKRITASEVKIHFETQSDVDLWADPVQFGIVVRAILRNGIEACGQRGEIHIQLNGSNTLGRLQFRDNGEGLTEEQQRHAFDPFYSGRDAGRGLGFGLSICWRIVKAHGGEILLESHQDRGCTTTVHWPLA